MHGRLGDQPSTFGTATRTRSAVVTTPFEIDLLDGDDPFEITVQSSHLFTQGPLRIGDVFDVWNRDPLFYPAKPPAHWLMVSQVSGLVLVVPLAPAESGDANKCRPIGCYVALGGLAARYREDRCTTET